MLKLHDFDVDESFVIEVNKKTIVVDYIPAIVKFLSLQYLNDENVSKIFYHLFQNKLSDKEIKQITPLNKLGIVRKLLNKNTISSESSDKESPPEDDYETTVNISSMITFLTANTNLSKHELLTKFTLIELIQLSQTHIGDREFDFYKHQKIARSINDLQSMFK